MKNNGRGKIKEAAALRFVPGEDTAPRIVAAGKGEFAESIIETAKENHVPLKEDSKLAHELTKLAIGQDIPPELYEVVAEILVFVANLDKMYGERYERKEAK